jgi:hypothetical protein|nr:MAG TPA: hypothetical protein [Caudoviricetes sp.]
MRMKSNLQIVKEYSDYRHAFLGSVEKLIEQYDVTDTVVMYRGGQLHEATSGYFLPIMETDILSDLEPMYGDGIRIRGGQFILGKVCEEISSICEVDHYLDLETYTEY